MSKRLLDYDPYSGMKTWFSYDHENDTSIVTYEGDCEGVLDQCKEDNNHADRKMGDLVHVARVPPQVQMEWLGKYGVRMWDKNHAPAVRRLLDGPYKYLKRLPIHLGKH